MRRDKKNDRWKWIAAAAALILVACAAGFLPLRAWAESFENWIDGLGAAGVALFAVVYALATLFFLPAWVLTVAAGALFGLAGGFALVWPSALSGATLAFFISRYALREPVRKRFSGNSLLRTVDRALRKQGWKVVALLRLSPLVPFCVQNYFYGTTTIRLRDYLLGSALGMVPGQLVYVWLGTTGRTAVSEGGAVHWALLAAGAIAICVASWMIGRMAKRQLGIKIR